MSGFNIFLQISWHCRFDKDRRFGGIAAMALWQLALGRDQGCFSSIGVFCDIVHLSTCSQKIPLYRTDWKKHCPPVIAEVTLSTINTNAALGSFFIRSNQHIATTLLTPTKVFPWVCAHFFRKSQDFYPLESPGLKVPKWLLLCNRSLEVIHTTRFRSGNAIMIRIYR